MLGRIRSKASGSDRRCCDFLRLEPLCDCVPASRRRNRPFQTMRISSRSASDEQFPDQRIFLIDYSCLSRERKRAARKRHRSSTTVKHPITQCEIAVDGVSKRAWLTSCQSMQNPLIHRPN